SFVIPNLVDDMHTGSTTADIQQGDTWLQQHLDAYVQWAKTHNSLFILTTDEEDEANGVEANPNQIATIFVGQHVQIGTDNTNITHYDVLRTIEDIYGLSPANNAANATAITGIWN
ncbi:MAG: acid phosphatase, partial [Chloroflexi bacterium]|nr:acid phosphatase [Chloroflexota bacterium]